MKTVLVPLAQGFEEIEAISIIDVLRRAGLKVTTVSLGDAQAVMGAHGIPVTADQKWSNAGSRDYDAIVLPGGPGYQLLMEHEGVMAALNRHDGAGKIVAAICASPAVLVRAGVLSGRRAACYPSVEADVSKVATLVHSSVCVDGRIVTSRGPSTAVVFAVQLVAELVGEAKSRQVASDMLLQN